MPSNVSMIGAPDNRGVTPPMFAPEGTAMPLAGGQPGGTDQTAQLMMLLKMLSQMQAQQGAAPVQGAGAGGALANLLAAKQQQPSSPAGGVSPQAP